MTGKYQPLTGYLRAAADRAERTVEMSFAEIAALVGGLPASASTSRQWWANSSHSQALAWGAAGYHVEHVYLDSGRVRFELGQRGGRWHDARRAAAASSPSRPLIPDAVLVAREPVGEPIDVHVVLQWTDAGRIELDATGKPVFGVLDAVPGLYRMMLTGSGLTRRKVYIGETDNLRRRLSGNYRNPGPRQQTSLRINALLREHLAAGGSVTLATASCAHLRIAGVDEDLDLTRKAGRLLVENAALVAQQVRDDADIANLG
jgi:hypothetical protein